MVSGGLILIIDVIFSSLSSEHDMKDTGLDFQEVPFEAILMVIHTFSCTYQRSRPTYQRIITL